MYVTFWYEGVIAILTCKWIESLGLILIQPQSHYKATEIDYNQLTLQVNKLRCYAYAAYSSTPATHINSKAVA